MSAAENTAGRVALHPYCQKCGWRKGGIDSWDGARCKCSRDNTAPPMLALEAEIVPISGAPAVKS